MATALGLKKDLPNSQPFPFGDIKNPEIKYKLFETHETYSKQ